MTGVKSLVMRAETFGINVNLFDIDAINGNIVVYLFDTIVKFIDIIVIQFGIIIK